MRANYSIIMTYYHRPDHLFNTLSTFRYWYADRADKYEILIMEDPVSAANKEYHEALLAVCKAYLDIDIHIIPLDKVGLSRAHNKGVEQAAYDYVMFNGPETLHARHIMRAYDEFFDKHPFAYGVGSCQCSEFPGRVPQVDPFTLHDQGFRFRDWYQHSQVQGRRRFLHFNAAIHRDVLDWMGGFCEGFDGGFAFEDDDFIDQVRYCGIPVHALDHAITVHQAHDPVSNPEVVMNDGRNEKLLIRRQGERSAGTLPKGRYKRECNMEIPIIINNRNILVWVQDMVREMARFPNVRVVVLDNASTYPPLLAWYETGACEVIRLDQNIGSRAPWRSGVVDRLLQESGQKYYGVTDPDLDLSSVPGDVVQKCVRLFEIYGDDLHKAGLSLALDELPDNQRTKDIVNWESQFWKHRCQPEWAGQPIPHPMFMSAIDTTWALYRKGSMYEPCNTGQVRLDKPYTARHLPWYFDTGNVSEEYAYYVQHANGCSTYATTIKQMIR